MKLGKCVFLLVIISAFFFSCSKEKSYEVPDANSGIYLPHTPDASWHYEDTASRTGFTLKATDRIDSIDKIRFYYYENIPDENPEDTAYTLMGKAGYNYYVSGFIPQLGDKKLLILKQDATIGETWRQPIALADYGQVELVFEMKEKGISHTVLGKKYRPVIHVGISAKFPVDIGSSGTDVLLPLGDLYFASGIGIIRLDVNFQGQAPSVHLLLTDYNIP